MISRMRRGSHTPASNRNWIPGKENRSGQNNQLIIDYLAESLRYEDLKFLKGRVRKLEPFIRGNKSRRLGEEAGYPYLREDLDQILDSRTLERARHYIKRLVKSLSEFKTNGINDINLNRWKEYDDIITDSLWIFNRRDTSGSHLGWYWGNFVPQIPHQIILRFTKRGDWVLDPFAGSGTSLIECIRLGRNGLGVDISPSTVRRASAMIAKEPNLFGVTCELRKGDSTTADFHRICLSHGIKNVQLVIMHPPYFDIIKFGKNKGDLSNATSVNSFLEKFGKVVKQTSTVLEDGRYLVLVAGDKYQDGEWVPLGFQMMEEVKKYGFKLTSIVVKNFEDTRAKRDQKELWRYRALSGGFYVFKHEYIFIFRKRKKGN